MQSIADRINLRMTELDISQADIMRATNAGRATVSGWVNGTAEPSAKHLLGLSMCLKCTSDWLIGGGQIQNQINNQHGYIGGSVSQSVVHGESNQLSGDDWLAIANNDMSPTFVIGDKVRIDSTQAPQAGNYVLVAYDGQRILRKYRPRYDDDGKAYIQLVASNEDYPIMDSRHQAFDVLGVAVECLKRLI